MDARQQEQDVARDSTVIDLSRGIYRKVYSGFLFGKRINAVSVEAEAWFWRLHMVADDFGNFTMDAEVLKATAAPLRPYTEAQIEAWNTELAANNLIGPYAAKGSKYGHIHDFEENQVGRNGRRAKRHPVYSGATRGDPVLSGGSSAYQDQDKYQDQDQRRGPAGIQTDPAGAQLSSAVENALAAVNRWSEFSRKTALNPVRNETQIATRKLEEIETQDTDPILHGGHQVAPILLVPNAVDALIAKRAAFTNVDYAMGCIKNRLAEFRTPSAPAEAPKPKAKVGSWGAP